MTVNQTFRQRLGEVLRERGAVKRVAHRAGYSEYYIKSLRCGRQSNPTISVVWALADALEVEPAWLLGIDE